MKLIQHSIQAFKDLKNESNLRTFKIQVKGKCQLLTKKKSSSSRIIFQKSADYLTTTKH